MPYWNAEFDGCDFAFDSLGAVVFLIVTRLQEEADLVVKKSYPEQSILVLLSLLESMLNSNPKCVSVHFRKQQYCAAKEAFLVWQNTAAKLPGNLENDLNNNALALFDRMDRRFGLI